MRYSYLIGTSERSYSRGRRGEVCPGGSVSIYRKTQEMCMRYSYLIGTSERSYSRGHRGEVCPGKVS